MSGRHAPIAGVRRGTAVLLSAATVLGLWFGLRAPDVSPVAVPAPATGVQPADAVVVTPAVPPQDDRGPRRGGGR